MCECVWVRLLVVEWVYEVVAERFGVIVDAKRDERARLVLSG